MGPQKLRSALTTKEPLWEEDFVFPLSNSGASTATALDILVCTTNGQDQDQLVGTTQVSVPRYRDENFEMNNFPLIDGQGRRRGFLVASCWLMYDETTSTDITAAAAAVDAATTPIIGASIRATDSPPGADTKVASATAPSSVDQSKSRILTTWFHQLSVNHTLCKGIAYRRWTTLLHAVSETNFLPSATTPDGILESTSLSPVDAQVSALTRAIHGMHTRLSQHNTAHGMRLLSLAMIKRRRRLLGRFWRHWHSESVARQWAERLQSAQKSQRSCEAALDAELSRSRRARLLAVVKRMKVRLLRLGLRAFRYVVVRSLAIEPVDRKLAHVATNRRRIQQRLKRTIEDNAAEVWQLTLCWARDKLCSVLAQRNRHAMIMRLAFERWQSHNALRSKEESLNRGHMKLRIDLDRARLQRSATDQLAHELHHTRQVCGLHAAFQEWKLQNLRLHGRREVKKAESQLQELFSKLQLLHARMQQVKQAEEDAFKAANARGANVMSNLGRLELKLQGSAVSAARNG